MKVVWMSDNDRSILRGCQRACAIGKMNIQDMRSTFNAAEKLDLEGASNDVSTESQEPKEYSFEDAELEALKSLFAEGKQGLPRTTPILRAALDCHAHMEAAKEPKTEK